jgi:hypothetical protein
VPKLPSKLKNKEFEKSHATFVAALEAGLNTIEENKDGFKSQDNPDIQLISISEARNMGVMPLGAVVSKESSK